MSEGRREHVSGLEAQQYASEAIGRAKDSGHWMNAVWFVQDGKVVLERWTSYQFPKADFDAALGLLALTLAAEKQRMDPPIPDPLPAAQHVSVEKDFRPSPVAGDSEPADDDPFDEEDDVE